MFKIEFLSQSISYSRCDRLLEFPLFSAFSLLVYPTGNMFCDWYGVAHGARPVYNRHGLSPPALPKMISSEPSTPFYDRDGLRKQSVSMLETLLSTYVHFLDNYSTHAWHIGHKTNLLWRITFVKKLLKKRYRDQGKRLNVIPEM